jgi:hypothetical protein
LHVVDAIVGFEGTTDGTVLDVDDVLASAVGRL